jgi:hypothetical protein
MNRDFLLEKNLILLKTAVSLKDEVEKRYKAYSTLN